jgi:hypothetical protein
LSEGFIKRMQPVFDDLNVDLSDVNISIGSKTGSAYTEGYDITLTTPGSGPGSYDYTAGELLHELGHVVQFENIGGATDMARMQALFSRQFQETQMAVHMYGDKQARYWQNDPYLRDASLRTLTKMELLSPSFTLDAQADRFRDVLMGSRSSYGF